MFYATFAANFFAFLRKKNSTSLSTRNAFLRNFQDARNRAAHNTIQMGSATCETSTETLFFILYGLFGVIILTGNLFTCVVFLTTEKLRQSKMNVLLVSLAVWDILMSVLVAPFYAVYCGRGCEYSLREYCWLMRGAKDCVKIGTTLNLYAITYDRYIAVLQPLQYSSKMAFKRVTAILAAVWCLPMILAGIRNFWQHSASDPRFANKLYDSIIVLGFVVLLVVLMLRTNVKIMRAIRKQAELDKRVRDLQNNAMSSQKRKGTVACVTVVVVFIICWLPRAVYNFSFIVDPPGLASPLFFRICFLFLFVQSALNPMIYWFYRSEFRRAAFGLLSCHRFVERAGSVLLALGTLSFLPRTAQIQADAEIVELSDKGHAKSDIHLTSYKTV